MACVRVLRAALACACVLLVVASAPRVSAGIPVYVMLPLDAATGDARRFDAWFSQLRDGGVVGINTDVWWGLVETSFGVYDWRAYRALLERVAAAGLRAKLTMSFHRCGGNVGDTCSYPLPQYVRDAAATTPAVFMADQQGHHDAEYISMGVDAAPVFPNSQNAVDRYRAFMESFAAEFADLLASGTVAYVQPSNGPAGELRFPSYQLSRWTFPGDGELQCWDDNLRAEYAAYAVAHGQSAWSGAPTDAGTYSQTPQQTTFFRAGGGFASAYGQFFLTWYSNRLIAHGAAVLNATRYVFRDTPVRIEAKVAGIHWQFNTPSHAAEQCAGYKNDKGTGYVPIARMFAEYGASFAFTCLEMRNSEQPVGNCNPEELVLLTEQAAQSAGIPYSGENALPRFDQTAFDTILYEAQRIPGRPIESFSYLRLSSQLMDDANNWNTFKAFVAKMAAVPNVDADAQSAVHNATSSFKLHSRRTRRHRRVGETA